MGRSFRIFDDNGDRKIDKQEFYWGLKDLGAEISMNEAQILLNHLDTKKPARQTNEDNFPCWYICPII